LKKWLGEQFTSNEEVVAQINAYFEDFPKPIFWTAEKVGETLGKVYKAKKRLC